MGARVHQVMTILPQFKLQQTLDEIKA